MKIKLIGCESTKDQVLAINPDLAGCGTFLTFDLHGTPTKLHNKLQQIIDQSQTYDIIILTYGRCGNSTVGLISPNTPMLLPKTHDCIGLIMGSNDQYQELLKNNKGCYFFSDGWLNYGKTPLAEYENYVSQYGTESADYLINTMYHNYHKAIYVGWDNLIPPAMSRICNHFNWAADTVIGDDTLLTDLAYGTISNNTLYVPANTEITSKMLV